MRTVKPSVRNMEDVQQKLRALLENIALEQKFLNYDLKLTSINSGGANYTSNLFIATITEGKKELNLFAKVAAIGEKMRTDFPMKLYDNERLFYRTLVKIFKNLEEQHYIPIEHKMRFPEFYGYSDKLYEETIVIENLVSMGMNSFDRFKTIDWDYATSSITEMAKFHALSIAYQEEYPEDSKRIIEELKFELVGDEEQMKSFWVNLIKQSIEATRNENKDRFKKFFDKDMMGRESLLNFNRVGKVAVIAHGDYRPSNLMHRVRQDGKLEVIPVDYQTIRAGCPVVDLLYFIFTGTDAEFRRNYYEKLIDFYYTELRAAMMRFALNPDEIYSRQDFDIELKERLPFGLAVAVFTLPVVTVEAENAPKVDENLGLADFAIQKTSSMYPERLNGVVDDYVRWGLI